MLIVGGAQPSIGDLVAIITTELYDPVAGTFTALADTMTAARAEHTATLLPDGRVLVTGGFASTRGNAVSRGAEMYTP